MIELERTIAREMSFFQRARTMFASITERRALRERGQVMKSAVLLAAPVVLSFLMSVVL